MKMLLDKGMVYYDYNIINGVMFLYNLSREISYEEKKELIDIISDVTEEDKICFL